MRNVVFLPALAVFSMLTPTLSAQPEDGYAFNQQAGRRNSSAGPFEARVVAPEVTPDGAMNVDGYLLPPSLLEEGPSGELIIPSELRLARSQKKVTPPTIQLTAEDLDRSMLPPELDPALEAQVQKAIANYQARARRSTQIALERRAELASVIMPAFIEAGIPLWLMNIAMVESQFNPKARSSAGPAGMWQLQAETARGLGLTVNSKVDERMDPEKSTQAVVKLLQSSYKTLNSWELTLAAYSAGTYRVKKAVEASPGSNLTALARKGLISGTCMNNVAMVLAAARIAESPEDHGFQPVSMNIDFGSLNSETRLLMEQLDQR